MEDSISEGDLDGLDEGFDSVGEDEAPDVPKKNESFEEQASNKEKISSLATSMRVVEDRYETLRKKLQMTDDELIEAQQSFEKERKVLDEQLLECKERIASLEEEIEEMKAEIGKAVRHRDFRYLKKYVEFWDPSQFITREEAETMNEVNTQNV